MYGRILTKKKKEEYIPTYIKKFRQINKSNKSNPCIKITNTNKLYCKPTEQKISEYRPRSYLMCLQKMGFPFFQNNTKKRNYLRKKLYNSYGQEYVIDQQDQLQEIMAKKADILVLQSNQFTLSSNKRKKNKIQQQPKAQEQNYTISRAIHRKCFSSCKQNRLNRFASSN